MTTGGRFINIGDIEALRAEEARLQAERDAIAAREAEQAQVASSPIPPAASVFQNPERDTRSLQELLDGNDSTAKESTGDRVISIALAATLALIVVVGVYLLYQNAQAMNEVASEERIPTVRDTVGVDVTPAVADAPVYEFTPITAYHAPNEASRAPEPIDTSAATAYGRCGSADWVYLLRSPEPAVWVKAADVGLTTSDVGVLRDMCRPTQSAPVQAPVLPVNTAPEEQIVVEQAPELVTPVEAGIVSLKEEFPAGAVGPMQVPATACTFETATFTAWAEVYDRSGAMGDVPVGRVEGYSCQSQQEAQEMANQRAVDAMNLRANP